jgi:hypothetical protein
MNAGLSPLIGLDMHVSHGDQGRSFDEGNAVILSEADGGSLPSYGTQYPLNPRGFALEEAPPGFRSEAQRS